MSQEEDRIRTIAGYLLKNNARLILRATPEVLAFVKASVLQAFLDASPMVRAAAGQDIVAFMGILEPRNWPECLQLLVHTLDSTSLDQQEVSRCLIKVSGIANVRVCAAGSTNLQARFKLRGLLFRAFSKLKLLFKVSYTISYSIGRSVLLSRTMTHSFSNSRFEPPLSDHAPLRFNEHRKTHFLLYLRDYDSDIHVITPSSPSALR